MMRVESLLVGAGIEEARAWQEHPVLLRRHTDDMGHDGYSTLGLSANERDGIEPGANHADQVLPLSLQSTGLRAQQIRNETRHLRRGEQRRAFTALFDLADPGIPHHGRLDTATH